MYFVRISNEDEVKMHNIADLVVFNCLDVDNGQVLPAVSDHVRTKVDIMLVVVVFCVVVVVVVVVIVCPALDFVVAELDVTIDAVGVYAVGVNVVIVLFSFPDVIKVMPSVLLSKEKCVGALAKEKGKF